MGASKPLRLIALATNLDRLWVPQLEQVLIIITGLSQICDLEKPENLPKKNFRIKPCPRSDIEDVDEGLSTKGIDFFGQYDPEEMVVTLQMCRMRRFATRHGFHLEDVLTIVVIHELAHFVTHLGKSDSSKCWVAFGKPEPAETVEDIAQQATNLYLRVASYGQLVQVFDSLSEYCPKKYKTWRDTWKKHFKNKDSSFETALRNFRQELCEARKKEAVPEIECLHECYNYDE
jgi:hypothetical protein